MSPISATKAAWSAGDLALEVRVCEAKSVLSRPSDLQDGRRPRPFIPSGWRHLVAESGRSFRFDSPLDFVQGHLHGPFTVSIPVHHEEVFEQPRYRRQPLASVPVTNLGAAIGWYERLFGRTADIVPNEHEVMWCVTGNGWLYVIHDPERAGKTVVTISVEDLDRFVAALADRGISAGPIEAVGEAGLKSNVEDVDGNSISLIQVTPASERPDAIGHS